MTSALSVRLRQALCSAILSPRISLPLAAGGAEVVSTFSRFEEICCRRAKALGECGCKLLPNSPQKPKSLSSLLAPGLYMRMYGTISCDMCILSLT